MAEGKNFRHAFVQEDCELIKDKNYDSTIYFIIANSPSSTMFLKCVNYIYTENCICKTLIKKIFQLKKIVIEAPTNYYLIIKYKE